ncbi:hypothetical protein ACH9EU_04985 [Kocuria sp. M1R5S2]|uniref:hypothetical protein n=1 Tax=Kocuria rhizosphaerae TaxID=3376285 RepID=UPI0037B5B338
MRHKLSVLVRIDLDGKHVALVVTGHLTGSNQQAVAPLVLRTRRMFPESEVSVDLQQAHAEDPEAVDLLRWSLEDARPDTGPVRITSPARHPGHRPSGRDRTAHADRRGTGPHDRRRP